MGRRLIAALGLAVSVLATAASAEAAEIANVPTNVISTTTGPTQTGRLDRDNFTSDCADPPKVAPQTGADPSSALRFRNHTLQSGLTHPICVEISLTTSCTIFSAAYHGQFDPANVRASYAADMGFSTPDRTSYSFEVGAEEFFSVVVHEMTANAGCAQYAIRFTSDGPWTSEFQRPKIGGTPSVGSTISGTDAVWRTTPSAPTVLRRWRRCDAAGANCTDIPGATGETYTVADADLGHTLRFRNHATDADGTSTSESEIVEPFVPFQTRANESLVPGDRAHRGFFVRSGDESRCGLPLPVPTILQPTNDFFYDAFPVSSLLNEPVCLVARTLPACGGGVMPSIFSPAFAPASGLATNYAGHSGNAPNLEGVVSTVLPAAGQSEVVVTLGFNASTCPSYTVTLGADAPFATARPAIGGTPIEADTLTASNGTWSGAPALSHSWLRCDADGAACAPIDGATGASYTPVAADTGRRLRARVTATQGRSVSSDSEPSPVIAAAPPGDRRAPKARIGLARTTLQRVVKRGFIPVNVTCDETSAIALRAEVTRKLGRRLGGAKIASGRGTCRAGRRTTIKVKLARRARRALRRRKSVSFTLKGTATDAAGNRATMNKRTTLKRKR